MLLRPATRDDEPAIWALTERLADFPLPPARSAREIAVADHPILAAQLEAPVETVLFLVAEVDGEVVGTVFANTRRDYFTGGAHAYVEVLAVSAEAAGQGIGRSLMEAVEEWARARHYPKVELAVFARNERARGLYRHLGYEEEIVRCVKSVGG